MNRMLNVNTLEPTKYGKMLNGSKKPLYRVLNGRHRLVKTILMGRKTVRANIRKS
jgi:hypothetical protein